MDSSTPLKLSGIPFSWEKLPGIPKKPPPSSSNQIPTVAPSSKTSLPPPPPSTTTTPKKHSKKTNQSEEWDPFVSALVQCSRDHDGGEKYRDDGEKGRNGGGGGGGGVWTVTKVPRRSIGDRLGFRVSLNGYGSCKVSSAVSDSIVYVPAGLRRRGGYGLVSDRRRR